MLVFSIDSLQSKMVLQSGVRPDTQDKYMATRDLSNNHDQFKMQPGRLSPKSLNAPKSLKDCATMDKAPRTKRASKPELLSPGGSLEKLRIAFLYGADAVYASGKDFGLRGFAHNLDTEELAAAT